MSATSLLDHLQEAGYMPDDDPQHDGWYELVVSGVGTIRVISYPGDGYSADVFMFDKFMACEWVAKFSSNMPGGVIVAALVAAEWQLAEKRGGPVTPMQAGTIN